MRFEMDFESRYRFDGLAKVRHDNFRILDLYAGFLNYTPCAVDIETVRALMADCNVPEYEAFAALFSAYIGVHYDGRGDDYHFSRKYVYPSIAQLYPEDYASDPYLKNIYVPDASLGKWRLSWDSYEPFEAFIYDDYLVNEKYVELPRIGFFNCKYEYPAVKYNKRIWMTVTPNEINTMAPAISRAKGNCVVFGLGLGYYAYMISEKPEVNRVTVVEESQDVIELFNEEILPQFGHKEKIEIIHDDAFEYTEKQMAKRGFDTAFADIWHDVGDGFELYLRFKHMQDRTMCANWDYWLETSMLSKLRWLVYDQLQRACRRKPAHYNGCPEVVTDIAQVYEIMSDRHLKELAKQFEYQKPEFKR